MWSGASVELQSDGLSAGAAGAWALPPADDGGVDAEANRGAEGSAGATAAESTDPGEAPDGGRAAARAARASSAPASRSMESRLAPAVGWRGQWHAGGGAAGKGSRHCRLCVCARARDLATKVGVRLPSCGNASEGNRSMSLA